MTRSKQSFYFFFAFFIWSPLVMRHLSTTFYGMYFNHHITQLHVTNSWWTSVGSVDVLLHTPVLWLCGYSSSCWIECYLLSSFFSRPCPCHIGENWNSGIWRKFWFPQKQQNSLVMMHYSDSKLAHWNHHNFFWRYSHFQIFFVYCFCFDNRQMYQN